MRMFKKLQQLVAGLSCIALLSCNAQNAEYADLEDGIYARFNTTKGKILVKLEHERAPMTTANFVGLAEGKKENSAREEGKPFYDGLKFHRVIADFMIQGGDPQGNGMGGPGYNFEDEFHEDLKHDGPGILSMANSGPGTNGSQFFITHKETPWLDNKHSIFGKVVEGQEIVDQIEQDDILEKLEIIRVGKDAEKFDALDVFAREQEKLALKKEEKKALADKELARLKSKAKTTETGLGYIVEKEGKGAKAKEGDKVSVHYELRLADGTLVDSSRDRGQAFSFTLGQDQLIPGWVEGVKLMNVGSKYKLIIPSSLGYGSQGAGGVIPPDATLIFDLELLDIE